MTVSRSHLQSEPVGSHWSGLCDVRSVPDTSVLTDSPDHPVTAPDGLHHALNLSPATALCLPQQLECSVPDENFIPGTEAPHTGQAHADGPQPPGDGLPLVAQDVCSSEEKKDS